MLKVNVCVVCLWCGWISNSTQWFIRWNNNSSHPLNTTNIACFIVSHPSTIQIYIIIDDPFSYLIPLVSDKFLLLRGILFLYLTLLMIRLAESNVFEYMNCYVNRIRLWHPWVGRCYIQYRNDTGVFRIGKLVRIRAFCNQIIYRKGTVHSNT